MNKLTKALTSLLIICLMAMVCGTAALAAGDLPDSFLIDDNDGISVPITGEYFLYSNHLMPGDIITRTLTLRNLEQGEPFQLHLLEESPESAGPVDWLDNLHLRITLDGSVLYTGRLRGDGAKTRTMEGNGVDLINTGLNLGKFEKGGYGTLEFVVTADAGHLSTEDLRESSTARMKFVFYAVKDAPSGDPKTGYAERYGMYALLLLLIGLCIVFYIRLRKSTENTKQTGCILPG